jgi:hypothetical protein
VDAHRPIIAALPIVASAAGPAADPFSSVWEDAPGLTLRNRWRVIGAARRGFDQPREGSRR